MARQPHLLSVSQFANADRLIEVFRQADKNNKDYCLAGKILGTLFLEASTRTRLSFESAMLRGGGKVISVADAITCSRSKGESIEDTVKTMSYYCDVIAMRLPGNGSVAVAATHSRVPVINGGDGDGEHPTQAVLDLYTVWKEFVDINDCVFILKGDLKYSRTVHSLCKLLKHFKAKVMAWPAAGLEWMGDSSTAEIEPYSEKWGKRNVVIYTTRPQKERWPSDRDFEYDGSEWAITKEAANWLPPSSMIMHALPRSQELPVDADDLPNLGIWKQVQHGVRVRSAIMQMAIEGTESWLQ